MKVAGRLAAAVLVAGGLCPLWARADTVVLRDGTRIAGEVEKTHRKVSITTAEGTLTLPLWRVVSIEVSGSAIEPAGKPAGRPPAPAKAQESPVAPEAEPASSPARAPKAGARAPAPARPVTTPPKVADVLARQLSVDFQGNELVDVLDYVRELTGVNMALHSAVLRDKEPVYLRVENVPVKTILDVVLKPRGLGYSVRPGEILYVHPGPGAPYVPRVYYVSDLLLSTEDRYSSAGGDGAGATSLSGRGAAGGTGFQFAGSGSRAGGAVLWQFGGARSRGGRGGGNVGEEFSPLTARAQNLVLLIKMACGFGTWENPADTGLIDVGGISATGQGAGYGGPAGRTY